MLCTYTRFISKVQSYVALLEDADSALPDAHVTAFIHGNMYFTVCADIGRRDHTEKELRSMGANTLLNKLLWHTEQVEWQLTTFSSVLPAWSSPSCPAVATVTDTPSTKVNFSKWYDPAICLPKGLLGCQVHQHLTEKGKCCLCRKVRHKSPECPKQMTLPP